MEDDILLKNGEIRVLRDSLKGAQQEKEAQRQNQIQLEEERQREQSDREKELNRKVRRSVTQIQSVCSRSGPQRTVVITCCLSSGSVSAVRAAV